jgi:hypothetical protein
MKGEDDDPCDDWTDESRDITKVTRMDEHDDEQNVGRGNSPDIQRSQLAKKKKRTTKPSTHN